MSFRGQLIKRGIGSNGTDIDIFRGSLTIAEDLTVEGNISGDFTLGDSIVDSLILKGRITTGTEAGAYLEIDATTYQYTEGQELKYAVVDWADVYTLNSFTGIKLAVEARTESAGGQIKGLDCDCRINDVTAGSVASIMAHTYIKGSTAKTVNIVLGGESEVEVANSSGTLTVTTSMIAHECRMRVSSAVAGGNLAKCHGLVVKCGDTDGGTQTVGTGVNICKYASGGGDCTWTLGLDISDATTGIDINADTLGIDIGSCTTGISFTGTVAEIGIDCTDATLTQGWNNAFFACGSGNGAAGDQHEMAVTDHYIPIQVNIASTAGPATPKEVCAAMLRVDAIDAGQNQSSVDVLCLRSDLSETVYAASGINQSTNISDDMIVGAGSLYGIYCSITGNKTITCGNTVAVFEARYAQTSGGGGVDSVATLSNIGTSCSITSILDVHNWSGTATNGILIQGSGTMTNGIVITQACTSKGIVMGTTGSGGTTIDVGTVSGEWHGVEISVMGDWAGEYANGIRCELEDTTGTAGSMIAGRFDVNASFNCVALNGMNCTVQISDSITLGGRVAAGYVSLYGAAGKTLTRTANSIYGLFVQHYLRSDPGAAENPAGEGHSTDHYNAGIGLSMPSGSYCDYGIVIKGETNGTVAAILIGPHGTTTWESGIRFKNGSPSDSDLTVSGGVTSAIYFDVKCPVVNLVEWETTGYGTGCVDTSDAISTEGGPSSGAIKVDVSGAKYYIPIFAAGSQGAGP